MMNFFMKYHFVPHPEEKRRASLLSIKALLVYTFITVLVLVSFKFVPRFFPGILGYASDISVVDLLNGTNSIRAENGLPPLKLNTQLSEAAYQKATDMFQYDYWAHISPSGTKPWDFILSVNYDYAYAGENLAKNFNTSDQVVSAWVKSPSHRDNLLSPNFDDIGFAVVDGKLQGYETTLVVQMFGRPRHPSYLASSGVPEGVDENVASVESESIQAPIPEVEPPNTQEPVLAPVIFKSTSDHQTFFGRFHSLQTSSYRISWICNATLIS
jgi:hypothetical protein